MIAFIQGQVVDIKQDHIIIDHHGMGYQVYVTNFDRIELNESLRIHTFFHVREDGMALFGFIELEEKRVFEKLISVKGIGPKTGMNILSQTTSEEFIQAISDENVKYLRTLPGVGPKMASQIVLDLKGTFVSNEKDIKATGKTPALLNEVNDVLSELGFKNKEIERIQSLLQAQKFDTIESALQFALQHIKK